MPTLEGYYKMPEKTAEDFVQHEDGKTYFHTVRLPTLHMWRHTYMSAPMTVGIWAELCSAPVAAGRYRRAAPGWRAADHRPQEGPYQTRCVAAAVMLCHRGWPIASHDDRHVMAPAVLSVGRRGRGVRLSGDGRGETQGSDRDWSVRGVRSLG